MSTSHDSGAVPALPTVVGPRLRAVAALYHAVLPYLHRVVSEAAVRVGCTVLALLGAMYAAAGLLSSPADVATGLAAVVIGVGGLGWARYREGK